MYAIGLPELLIIAVVLVPLGIAIWFSLKAKPLGGKPYRWGTWTGISCGLGSLMYGADVPVTIRSGQTVGAVIELALVGLSITAAVGLLARHKIGVVALAGMIPLALFAPGSGTWSRLVEAAVSGLIIAAYFGKRWPSLAPANPPSTARNISPRPVISPVDDTQ